MMNDVKRSGLNQGRYTCTKHARDSSTTHEAQRSKTLNSLSRNPMPGPTLNEIKIQERTFTFF
ncbi:uncharacterized protein G2W53_005424 [Senna tora]|uniref:Uncharacterized protein n=1 Tax=Senna tora TaxID=362788 RepID=A0A835CFK2_9FABA|nr:uncharacterized protein G2W53_005424 [Senna tora]